ncbi:phosphotransferase [Algoriphagus sediminis]|uniref:Phosphotransferase n=1 Tax=Algoriphagus sediminis TaxID=3057113 RepID=A0ABT7YDJ1_9BACT|nr:phosphotransferase [Algoriphagus sediminis]MDN3204595.1 phosphotransferase [Algoriphagus sediminis]
MHLLNKNPESFINSLSFLDPDEIAISAEKAGEGNMNAVFRIQTNKRTFIAKQSFPFVRKYPQISAPIERIDTEYQYLKLVEIIPELKSYSPKILGYFPENYLLLLEDFGPGSDFTEYYKQSKQIKDQVIEELIAYLNQLHSLKAPFFPDNMKMRELNHDHIFRFPFDENNGLDLDSILPGLQKASLPFKMDEKLKSRVASLGERYLSKGDTLLHGDFYPGSWISTESGLKVIDPEFGFVGDREFDLGIFVAHLIFSGLNENEALSKLDNYNPSFDSSLTLAFAGVELLRRLIGIAQLPLDLSLKERVELLQLGRKMILA